MYSDKDSKEFLESQRYYERAALIHPHSGNAHNQVVYFVYSAHVMSADNACKLNCNAVFVSVYGAE